MSWAIEANRLTKRFGAFTAVDEVSFQVNPGEVFGFLGANGAGKTTCIRMLTGLIHPTEGSATVSGYDVRSQTEKVKRSIGYMSQRFSLYPDLSIRENIVLFGGIYGLSRKAIRTKMEEVLQELGLEDVADSRVASIPLGWKQKLAFSVAMLHEPGVVFLDEPTSGVDPITRQQFWELIYRASERGVTIFLTTHYMPEAEYCDRVAIMAAGKLEALETPNGLKADFGVGDIADVFVKINELHRKSLSS
jgi:ABC-2 type transport system ATP-binding protein